MRCLIACLALLSSATGSVAAEKKLPLGETSNQLVDISATAIMDKDEIRQEIGADPGTDLVVVRVTFRPVSDKPIQINLDDFMLVSDKDGQRSQPFAPSQLAGDATLVVTPQTTRVVTNNNGPSLGIPGIGGIGRRSSGKGNNADPTANAPANPEPKVETSKSDKENPLLAALTAKCLPEKEVTDPVTGLLYFQSVGTKLKLKDLELHYKGPGGRLALRFGP